MARAPRLGGRNDDAYPFPDRHRLDYRPLLAAVVADRLRERALPEIARAFHHAVAGAVVTPSGTEETKIVASGGVFPNGLLVALLAQRLGDRLWINQRVPANDGGISSVGGLAAALFRYDLNRTPGAPVFVWGAYPAGNLQKCSSKNVHATPTNSGRKARRCSSAGSTARCVPDLVVQETKLAKLEIHERAGRALQRTAQPRHIARLRNRCDGQPRSLRRCVADVRRAPLARGIDRRRRCRDRRNCGRRGIATKPRGLRRTAEFHDRGSTRASAHCDDTRRAAFAN